MMPWIGTPVSVEEIAVLVHLVLVWPQLAWLPIRSSDRDRQIEGRRFEDALLADQWHPSTFEAELLRSAQAIGTSP